MGDAMERKALVLLSGGQDSSALVALARRVRGPDTELHTFSYRGGGGAYDEGPFIDAACAAVGAIGHEVRLSPEEWAADLPALVEFLLTKHCQQSGRPFAGLSHEAMQRVLKYPWPGNIRELDNAIQRAVVLGEPPLIEVTDLPQTLWNAAVIRDPDLLEEAVRFA